MYVRRKGKNRILFFLGFLICVLPLILNFFFHQSVENVISSFYLEEEKMDETDEFKAMMERARKDILAQLAINSVLKDITVTDQA